MTVPAEHQCDTTGHSTDRNAQQYFGRTALVRSLEIPNGTEHFSLEATVDDQRHSSSSHSVHYHIKELHPHGVENLKGEQGSCSTVRKDNVNLFLCLRTVTELDRLC